MLENNQIRGLDVIRACVIHPAHDLCDPLGIVLVHLATVGLQIEFLSWHDQIDDFRKLIDVTAFLGNVTIWNITRHFAIAYAPCHAALGVQPNELFGLLLDFP